MSDLRRYKRVGEKRRLLDRRLRAFSHPGKNVQIGKMHDSEDHQHHSDLVAQQLDGFAQVVRVRGGSQRQRDVTDVNQIEAHNQQVIDRIGQLDVGVEGVDEK